MLYFIIALLDKWVSLIDGGSLTGLTSSDPGSRMPVGFGLAYCKSPLLQCYCTSLTSKDLVGAVLLDFNAHRLHELSSKTRETVVPTDSDINSAALIKAHNRKRVYWITLGKYLLWHVWGLAGTATLVWVFASKVDKKPMIIFLSYVLAYTGLLWYQVRTALLLQGYLTSDCEIVHEVLFGAACPQTDADRSFDWPTPWLRSPPRVP
jgi:hypothetical protein